MNKQLKSLDEHNQEVVMRKRKEEQPLNGIACPLCGNELKDTNPHIELLSWPPQYRVHCSVCVWTGTRY